MLKVSPKRVYHVILWDFGLKRVLGVWDQYGRHFRFSRVLTPRGSSGIPIDSSRRAEHNGGRIKVLTQLGAEIIGAKLRKTFK